MNPVNINLPKGITDLVAREGQAITEMLAIEAHLGELGRTTDDALTDAQQRVIDIGKLIALALEPNKQVMDRSGSIVRGNFDLL